MSSLLDGIKVNGKERQYRSGEDNSQTKKFVVLGLAIAGVVVGLGMLIYTITRPAPSMSDGVLSPEMAELQKQGQLPKEKIDRAPASLKR
jgi:hypothetical protein